MSKTPRGYTTEFGPEILPYHTAIGKLAHKWADFEFGLNEAIWELANVEKMVGTSMTSQMIGPGPRFRCLISLLHLRKAPDVLIKAMNSLSGDAESIGRQRNRFLHDPMVADRADNSIHRLETTADRTVKHDAIAIELKEIDDLIDKIRTVDVKFDDIYLRVLSDTPPWPRTQFEQSWGFRRIRPSRGPHTALSTPERPQ